ncbi:MAG: hypothetical protein A3C44_01730 [Gammaproteobacteria bacterium RIFCSPHIGHO2_02_FULL_39_13]|nr:MAG: hypothetical protein A3C44_01730 [Gammaproteobacteria bacterium RIFCSPHIGHO2_02_FULL_39_13]
MKSPHSHNNVNDDKINSPTGSTETVAAVFDRDNENNSRSITSRITTTNGFPVVLSLSAVAAISGLVYFIVWTLKNNAGSLILVAEKTSELSKQNAQIYDSISCQQLVTMNSSASWPPNFPVSPEGYPPILSVASLLKLCAPSFIKHCATILANALFHGSAENPYTEFDSRDFGYGFYGLRCQKDSSAWIAVAFIAAVMMLSVMSIYGVSLLTRNKTVRERMATLFGRRQQSSSAAQTGLANNVDYHSIP